MAADALKAHIGAEAAMIASGMFHTSLPTGRVSLGQLHKSCFSSANPAVTEVKGIQILHALERGLDPKISKLEPPSFRGTPVGIPQISGIQGWYEQLSDKAKRIQRLTLNGEQLDPDKWYLLAHTDAEVSTDSGYLLMETEREPKKKCLRHCPK